MALIKSDLSCGVYKPDLGVCVLKRTHVFVKGSQRSISEVYQGQILALQMDFPFQLIYINKRNP